MYMREMFVYSQPPLLRSPPPIPSPLDTNRSYRWTSMTAANNSKLHDTPLKTLSKKPDTSWSSPSHGDTWRLNAPRGRTLNLVAAFDQCARQDQLDSPKYVNLRRYRRNSEPMQENEEKEMVTTNFIDDSMIDDHEYEEHDIDLDMNYYDPVEHYRSGGNLDKTPVTVEKINPIVDAEVVRSVGCGDSKLPMRAANKVESPFVDETPRRLRTSVMRDTIQSLDKSVVDSVKNSREKVFGIDTSTPMTTKGNYGDFSKYFGHEESILDSPKDCRERRCTQTITIPSFDSPASSRKFKNYVAPLPLSLKEKDSRPVFSHVKNIAQEFEKADFGFHRKIDVDSEIAELRRDTASSIYDENQNMIPENAEEVSLESVPRISHLEMRPSIQMGVSGYTSKHRGASSTQNDHEEEVLYSLPVKNISRKIDCLGTDHTDEKQIPLRGKAARQSLPFSDIPEERTCDKIDEMFDFVEVPTGDFDEKATLDRTVDGYAEVKPEECPTKVHMNISTNTYQEIEFERDTTPYVQQLEGDGTGYSTSSGIPQFTRSSTLVTPHAGQSVTEYRVSEKEGCATTEKIVVQKMSQPSALATSTPKGTFAWRSKGQSHGPEDSFVSSISNFSAADKLNDSRRQISKLIETIEKTRKHIQLAEISLIDAKRSRMVVQELASQRVLLICRERLKLQLDEVRRLQALSVVRHPPPPINRHFKSEMVISNISIHLNKNFNCRGSFAFIVALKCRTEIEATGVVTLLAHYQTRMHIIHFGEHMHFSNLPVDFVISMEVYMMRVPEHKAPEKTCVSVLAAKFRSLLVPSSANRRPKTNSISANRTVVSLPEYQAPECEFKFCGKLTLDRDSSGDRQFYLDDVTYPLEGTVKLQSHCSSLPEAIDVEYRGFLYLFDERSPNGEAAWDRYWAMLHRGIIFFWKNPVDEKTEKVPLSQIDLTKCTNQSVEETKNERAHEFHIELLIDQTPSLLEKRLVVLAAESADHLSSWLNAINDTLHVLRS